MICSLNLKMPGNYEHKALLYYFLSNRIAYNALCISLTIFRKLMISSYSKHFKHQITIIVKSILHKIIKKNLNIPSSIHQLFSIFYDTG